ncbi:MAG: cell division protein SepF [Tissierellia bacterium]|nr:cell division protein SepF [Tissierellia bacterium]
MSKILNKFKYLMGIDDLDMDEDYEEYGEDLLTNTKSKRVNNKVVNIHTSGNMKLVVHEPLNYEDAPKIIDDIKIRKAVIVSLEQLDPEMKRQVFDFINGGLYSLEANIQKVTTDIFVLAPNNVEIDNNMKNELKNNEIFRW